jgi:(4S)-4-hydroxy-5-phosphonooxypentane-2,3-dione isomerase
MTNMNANGFVVVVDFIVRPEHLDRFLPAMMENASTSLRDEPNCFVFDVCQDPKRPERIYLYEVYGAEEDFQFHLKCAHFVSFNEISQPWVAEKRVETLQRCSAPAVGE